MINKKFEIIECCDKFLKIIGAKLENIYNKTQFCIFKLMRNIVIFV